MSEQLKPKNRPLLQRLTKTDSNKMSMIDYLYSIKQDIEALLNTFCADYFWDAEYSQLQQSLLSFGMRNYFKKNYSDLSNHSGLCYEIKRLIESKEPRLINVRVFIFDEIPDAGLILYLRIEASLCAERDDMDRVLDLKLDPLTMSFKVL